MDSTLTVTEAARNFSEVINRVVYRGESMILKRNGKIVARIVPEETHRTDRALTKKLAAHQPMPAEEAEEFAQDIEEGRRIYNQPVMRDPWAE